jgi:hypothetical protein
VEYVFEDPFFGAFDLPGHFYRYGVPLPEWTRRTPRRVPVWTDLVALNESDSDTTAEAREAYDKFIEELTTEPGATDRRERFILRWARSR